MAATDAFAKGASLRVREGGAGQDAHKIVVECHETKPSLAHEVDHIDGKKEEEEEAPRINERPTRADLVNS